MTGSASSYRGVVYAFVAALVLSCVIWLQPAYADAGEQDSAGANEALAGASAEVGVETLLSADSANLNAASDEADALADSADANGGSQDAENAIGDNKAIDLEAPAEEASAEVRATAVEAGAPSGAAAEQGGVQSAEQAQESLAVANMTVQSQAASVSYSTHVQNIGWQNAASDGKTAGTTGQSLRLEGLKITISGASGSVVYQTHVQNIGWQDSVADGRQAGTTGQALRLEALRIWLSGAVADQYDILYRTHVQDIGWQDWVSNGELAGTTGRALRLEAIEVKLSEKKQAVSDGTPSISYQAHVQDIGWQGTTSNGATAGTTGRALRVEALKLTLNTGNFSGGITYQAHVQNVGWQGWVTGGALAGTTGQALRVEALRIMLTGDIANTFDIQYRVHVQDVGWEPWVYNGMGAGTVGNALRIEAIEIKLVSKATKTGWEGSGSNWAYVENGVKAAGRWLVTDVGPMNEFDFGLQRYWIDANGTMAVSRFINPESDIDNGAGYVAFATDIGAVQRGKMVMSGGVLLADDDGRVPIAAGWVTTSVYDGSSQKYYLEKSGVAALAKTGLITVDGAQYYAVPREGYIMCSGYWHLNGAWYAAAADGKLTLDTDGNITKYIERYISWAIAIANDNSHGYSQGNRWGPDYDCSSFVVSALKNSGFAVGGATWTGNMISELTKYGFQWYTNMALLQRGDLLLAHNSENQHTEIYLGSSQIVGATISENGGIYGAAGDQTGREIRVGSYYNMPWDGFLRYVG